MSGEAHAVIHFMDGTKIVFKYPRLQAKQAMDSSTIASTVKKALDQDKIVVEADGSLIVIPVRNIKYIQTDCAAAGRASCGCPEKRADRGVDRS